MYATDEWIIFLFPAKYYHQFSIITRATSFPYFNCKLCHQLQNVFLCLLTAYLMYADSSLYELLVPASNWHTFLSVTPFFLTHQLHKYGSVQYVIDLKLEDDGYNRNLKQMLDFIIYILIQIEINKYIVPYKRNYILAPGNISVYWTP